MQVQDPMLFERLAWRVAERMPGDGGGRVLLVTSARPGEGKTFIAEALAAALNLQKPGSIVLVDCSRSSAPETVPETSPPTFRAMSPLATSQSGDRMAVHRMCYGSGDVATAFRGADIATALDALRKNFGYVILDGPVLANCGALSDCADGGLLVVNAKRTAREIVSGTLRSHPLASRKLLGVVLNERPVYVPAWLYRRFL